MRLPSMTTPVPVTSCGVPRAQGRYGSGRLSVEKILTTEFSMAGEAAGDPAAGATVATDPAAGWDAGRESCAWATRLAQARARAAMRTIFMTLSFRWKFSISVWRRKLYLGNIRAQSPKKCVHSHHGACPRYRRTAGGRASAACSRLGVRATPAGQRADACGQRS